MFDILVVEDDANTRLLLTTVLKRSGYNLYVAENGRIALDMLEKQHIDLIVLDIMMPEMDGYEFTTLLRESGDMTPILMATARQLPVDKKKGFSAGADDYMTKPLDTDEMLWRIKALLRRAQIVCERRLTVGELVLNYDEMSVTRNGACQTLPQKEFQLLYLLLSNPNRIFTRLQIMDQIWGVDSESGGTTVNVHIDRLRRRFADTDAFALVAVRGVGYKAVVKT